MKLALRDTLVIARRELLERVRSKWYVAMTILGPAFMIAMIVLPAWVMVNAAKGARVEIIDHTHKLAPAIVVAGTLQYQWTVTEVPVDTPEDVELQRIHDDKINGFLVIPENGLDDGVILYRGDNASGSVFSTQLQVAVQLAVFSQRLMGEGFNAEKAERILKKVNVVPLHSTGEAAGTSGMGSYIIAYALSFILYMVLTIYGVAVMRSVVQEKTSRVMEFMVAAVKPSSLMGGKVLGVCAAASIQLIIWLGVGVLVLNYREIVLGWFHIESSKAAALPEIAGPQLGLTLAFFFLGFFFYSSMYAAVGALVSSEQDTQQVQLPVTMLLVIGVICMQVVSNAPRGSTSAIMSMIPMWSPMLMPMRYVLGGASLGEVAMSLGLLVLATYLVVRAAAKIYRVGVLMYGKRPSIKELIRWLRY